LIKYEPLLLPNGLLFLNSSLIEPKETFRKDIEIFSIPVNEIAINHGNPKLSNMVALGAFNEKTKLVQMSSLIESLGKVLDERYHHLIPSNVKALEVGANYVQSL
jgi:2-oxoglutarate ferredoxin oxidoreductase subunit gamma